MGESFYTSSYTDIKIHPAVKNKFWRRGMHRTLRLCTLNI